RRRAPDRHRTLAELPVRRFDLVGDGRRNRRIHDRLANPSSALGQLPRVMDVQPVQLRLDNRRKFVFLDELEVCISRDDEAWWDGDGGPEQLSEVGAFATDEGEIFTAYLFEP